MLRLAKPVDAKTYEATHAVVRAHLRASGVGVDESAKDASRTLYTCQYADRARGYRFRVTHGAALDAAVVLAAQPPPPPRPTPAPPPRPEHRGAYIAGALRKASTNIANAAPGERHGALCREVYGLARLGLTETEIARALPAWVSAAGEARARGRGAHHPRCGQGTRRRVMSVPIDFAKKPPPPPRTARPARRPDRGRAAAVDSLSIYRKVAVIRTQGDYRARRSSHQYGFGTTSRPPA